MAVDACNWYATAADKGLPDAINNLGACDQYPGFTQHDMNRAIALYTLAARKAIQRHRKIWFGSGVPFPRQIWRHESRSSKKHHNRCG